MRTRDQDETWHQRYPIPCGQTNTCENITFPQLRWRAVIISNIVLPSQHDSRCNIHHFPVYKWNIHLCMSLDCALNYIILLCTRQPRGLQAWGKCLHLHMWGDGISCKWECYNRYFPNSTPFPSLDIMLRHSLLFFAGKVFCRVESELS